VYASPAPHTHTRHEGDFNMAGHFQASLRQAPGVSPRVRRMCACTLFSALHSLVVFYLLPTTTPYPALYWLGRRSSRTPCEEKQTALLTTTRKNEGALQAPNLSDTRMSHHWTANRYSIIGAPRTTDPVGLPKTNRLGRKNSRKIPAAVLSASAG
jgi:hypothetical protein